MDDPRFDYVTMDNDGAMTELVHALAARGRRDVRFVVRWPELVTTRQRMAAFAREGDESRASRRKRWCATPTTRSSRVRSANC